MDIAEIKTELDIRLDDTDNFALTSDEKTSIVKEAIKDQYTVASVWDDTLSYTEGTWEYELPDEVTTVKDILVKRTTESDPETTALKWDVVGRNLQFKATGSSLLTGTTLYLKGHYKYLTTDTIEEVRVQEYVLALAQLRALQRLGMKKVLKFLKNDVSVSEILGVQRELERTVSQYRSAISREFQSA